MTKADVLLSIIDEALTISSVEITDAELKKTGYKEVKSISALRAYMQEYDVRSDEIGKAFIDIKSGKVLSGGSPETIIKMDGDRVTAKFDGDEIKITSDVHLIALLILFAGDNGDPNHYIK